MIEDRLDRVVDYFDAWDLVQLLGLSTQDILEAFADEIEDKLEQLEEIMEA